MQHNGKKYTKNYLSHEEFMNGGEIMFRMDCTPNMVRGTEEEDLPYSFSR